MTLFGISAFIYGLSKLLRHYQAYDYKAMTSRDRSVNGQPVRDVLTAIVFLGLLTSISSFVITLFSINTLLSK
jgi:hypothetical protein